jgi:hypothetical protein
VSSSESPPNPPTDVALDAESFEPRYKAVQSELWDQYKNVRNYGGDIESSLHAILDDTRAFAEFDERMQQMTKGNSFDELPRFRRDLPNVHHLTVGPWRGVFLVSSRVRFVYGIIFTKSPHAVTEDFKAMLERAESAARSREGQ